MFHHDLARTGLSQFDTSTNRGTLKWKFETGGAPFVAAQGPEVSSPAVGADGTIYVSSLDGLHAIDPDDGIEKWRFTGRPSTFWASSGLAPVSGLASRPRVSSPAVATDGTIYVAGGDRFYAIDTSGNEKWDRSIGVSYASPAVGIDGTIYLSTYTDKFYAMNADGSQKWMFGFKFGTDDFYLCYNSSPAGGADGTAYSLSVDGCLYALNPDGTQKWKFSTNSVAESSPAVGAGGTVYVGAEDGKLYAINPDGSQKWKFSVNNCPVDASPAVGDDGTVFIGSDDRCLYAVNSDGTQKWKFTVDAKDELYEGPYLASSPAIGADGTVYVGLGPFLYAVGNP